MVGGRVRSETSELVPVGIRGSRDLVKWDSAYLVPLCQRGIQDTQCVLTSLQVAHRPVVPGNRLTLSIIKPQSGLEHIVDVERDIPVGSRNQCCKKNILLCLLRITAVKPQAKRAGLKIHDQKQDGLSAGQGYHPPDARKAHLGMKYINKSRTRSLEHWQMQTAPKI